MLIILLTLILYFTHILGEREKRSLAEMKAKNLEKKLEMYQSVKVAIDGTLPGTQDIPLIFFYQSFIYHLSVFTHQN